MPDTSMHRWMRTIALVIVFVLVPVALRAETIGRCGQGWLEQVDGTLVLHNVKIC